MVETESSPGHHDVLHRDVRPVARASGERISIDLAEEWSDVTVNLDEPPAEHTIDLSQQKEPAATAVEVIDAFRPGQLIRDRYVIEEIIGEGGFARVYRARDIRRDTTDAHDHHVALKVLRPELRERPAAIARLKQEFRQTQRLSHPNIVRAIDLDAHDNTWFMVMELLEGETLAAQLRRWKGEPAPLSEALTVLAACADALSFAHQHDITHGDFKPTNVFVLNDGGVRIIDFGSSSDSSPRASGYLPEIRRTATPGYASPQVLKRAIAGPCDDLFSFASVAFEMLTGRRPSHSSSAAAPHDKAVVESSALSKRQLAVLTQGLARQPEDRPASVREFFLSLTMRELPDLAPQDEAAVVPAVTALVTAEVVVAPDTHPAPVASTYPEAHPASPELSFISKRFLSYVLLTSFALFYLGFLLLRSPDAELAAPEPTRSETPAVALASIATAEPGSAPEPLPREEPVAMAEPATEPESQSAEATPAITPPPVPRAPAPTAAVSFDTSSMTVADRAVAAAIILKRVGNSSGRLRAKWQIEEGSAKAGQDFSGPMSGVAEFADLQPSSTLFVPLLEKPEHGADRTFVVQLTQVSKNAPVAPVRDVMVTIVGAE